MANVYRCMVNISTSGLSVDPVEVEDVRTALMTLQASLIQLNDYVKQQFDQIKQSSLPDFEPSSEQVALICSVQQNDSFLDYSQKISDFISAVIVPLESGINTNTF